MTKSFVMSPGGPVAAIGATTESHPLTNYYSGVELLKRLSGKYRRLGDLWLEIPRLGVKMAIVGVPVSGNTWDVTWLGDQAGWLNGTAYPASAGNSVLTGHVYLPNGRPGPFVKLNTLWWGDKIIVHVGDSQYTYEVRSVQQIAPGSIATALKHETLPWLTLLTCKGFDQATNSYTYRIIVRAVLVSGK